MAKFIISPYAISFDSIKNNLMNYVNGKHEGEAWKDFYASSAGQTVIELIAALGTFYAFHFITGRRESYLPVAQNYTSLVGLAQNNGYSCNRGNNLRLQVKLVPNQSVVLPKWSIIGNYGEYDVVITEDTILNKGVKTNVSIIIGNLLEESINITSSEPQQFTFLNSETTEMYRLLLNGEELPLSTQIKDLINDKYVTITNTYGSFDAFYLNEGQYKYGNGDTLTSQFIERNTLNYANFNAGNITIDYASLVDEITLLEDLLPLEDKEQIRINAPLYHETSMTIRSRKDYSKYLKQANPYLIAANDRDICPGLIELSYIKRDGSLMVENEKNYWLNQIEESRPSGVAKAIISDPIEVNKKLKITIWKANGEYFADTLEQDIDKLLSKYDLQFAPEIDLNQLEHEVEQLQGVKIARIELISEEWQADHKYNYYDVIETDYGNFYMSKLNTTSGSIEPIWPTEIGDIVIDNHLIWEKVDELATTNTKTWKPDTIFDRYDYITIDNTSTDTFGAVGTVQPIWGPAVIEDHYVQWTKLDAPPGSGTIHKWAASRVYYLDDIIEVSELIDDETPHYELCYYKCTQCFKREETNVYRVSNIVFRSGLETPTWGEDIIYDNNLVWRKLPLNTITWSAGTEFVVNDIIKTSAGYYQLSGFTSSAYSISAKSGGLEPKWLNSRGNPNSIVYDNVLVWRLLSTEYLGEWESDKNYQIGNSISTEIDGKTYNYTVVSFVGTSGNSTPIWEELEGGRILDGNIVWSLMSSELKVLKLDWNQYIRLSKDNTNFTVVG